MSSDSSRFSASFVAPPAPSGTVPGSVPSFSVLMPVYQAAATVGEALGSAFSQTLPPHEVIVCDDGSTDDLGTALAPYRDRIVLVHQENRGAAAALNSAARRASGEFVVALDADDVYLPERLEALGALASARPDLDLLTTDAYIERDGHTIGRYYRDASSFEVDDQRSGIIKRDFIFGVPAVRRHRLLAVGGFDERLERAQDRDCWLRLIMAGARAGLVYEPLVRYRLRPGTLSSDRSANLRAGVEILERARARETLSPAEERLLMRCVATMRREAALGELEDSLKKGLPDGRRRALAVAGDRRQPLRTRLKGVAAALAPGVSGRYLARRRHQPREPRLASGSRSGP